MKKCATHVSKHTPLIHRLYTAEPTASNETRSETEPPLFGRNREWNGGAEGGGGGVEGIGSHSAAAAAPVFFVGKIAVQIGKTRVHFSLLSVYLRDLTRDVCLFLCLCMRIISQLCIVGLRIFWCFA